MPDNSVWYRRSTPRGDTLTIDYQVINVTDGVETIVDITGCTFTYSCKTRPTSTGYVFQRTVGTGITLTNPTNGQLQIVVPAATMEIAPGDYYTDLQMVSGSVKTTRFREVLTVTPDITRT